MRNWKQQTSKSSHRVHFLKAPPTPHAGLVSNFSMQLLKSGLPASASF